MNEQTLNTIIKNSFSQDNNFAYKIPDPGASNALSTNKRPFDGFVIGKNFGTVCWEAKFQRTYKAFSFSLIQPHQIENLTKISNFKLEKVFPLIILGVWESRKYFDIFLFDINYILNLTKREKKSILFKELLELKDNYAIEVKNQLFSIEGFENKIIRNM
jgi:penicillin-binding protein-related factor A (putative recombinase)